MKFSINVLGKEIGVVVDSEELNKLLEEDGDDPDTISGFFLQEPAHIILSEKVSAQIRLVAFFHELLHAIGYVLGNPQLALATEETELFVDAVARALASAFQSPALIKFISACTKEAKR